MVNLLLEFVCIYLWWVPSLCDYNPCPSRFFVTGHWQITTISEQCSDSICYGSTLSQSLRYRFRDLSDPDLLLLDVYTWYIIFSKRRSHLIFFYFYNMIVFIQFTYTTVRPIKHTLLQFYIQIQLCINIKPKVHTQTNGTKTNFSQ